MTDSIRPPHSPSYHQKSEPSHTHLDTTPPLTLPKTATNPHANSEHPLRSQHAANKAEELVTIANPKSAICETDLLFERGLPKNGAAVFAALKVLTQH